METEKPIKKIMKEHHVSQWKVAYEIGMNESVLCRKLRDEPTGEFRQRLLDAIMKLANK